MPNKQITIAGAATLLKGRSFYTYSKTFAFTNNVAAIALADVEKYSAQDALNVKAGDLVLDTAGQVAIVNAVNDTIAVVKSAVNLKGSMGPKGDTGSVAAITVSGSGSALTDIKLNADKTITATKSTIDYNSLANKPALTVSDITVSESTLKIS